MTVRLDTTMQKYEDDGGDYKFIKRVTTTLMIDRSCMKVMSKRLGSVIVTFRVKTDGSLSLDNLRNQLNNIFANQIIGKNARDLTPKRDFLPTRDITPRGRFLKKEITNMNSD
jgi:hypothetical protein